MAKAPAILSKLPAEYRAASKAMAKLVRLSEATDVRAKVIAMEVYAYQAKDIELIAPATTTRRVAERRIGALIEEQRKAGKLAKGTRGKGRPLGGVLKTPPKEQQTLDEQGVDQNLASAPARRSRCRKRSSRRRSKKAIRFAVAAVQRLNDQWDASCYAAVGGFVQLGRDLHKAKAELRAHGKWLDFVENDLKFHRMVARMFMKIATWCDTQMSVNDLHLAKLLPPDYNTIYKITRLDEISFKRLLNDGTICPRSRAMRSRRYCVSPGCRSGTGSLGRGSGQLVKRLG
jgi:hypothetical protein